MLQLNIRNIGALALFITLLSTTTPALSLPDILSDADLKSILEALKARDPKFNKHLCDAMTDSDIALGRGQYAPGSPEQTVLAYRSNRMLGLLAQRIHKMCANDAACIEDELNGELGEFMAFVLHPEKIKTNNARFKELYNNHADELGLIEKDELAQTLHTKQTTLPKTSVQSSTQSTIQHTESTPLATPIATASSSQPAISWEHFPVYDLTSKRLLTYLALISDRAGFYQTHNTEAHDAKENWDAIKADAQKDAQYLYETHCPSSIMRLFSSSVTCNACDTLAAIIKGDIYEEAIQKGAIALKSDSKRLTQGFSLVKFSGWLNDYTSDARGIHHVANVIDMPLAEMLNPAALQKVFTK